MQKRLVYGAGLSAIWYYVGAQDVEFVRTKNFNAGASVSQQFKAYPLWDGMIEPLLIRQFTIVFVAGHSFILGMASDNPQDQHIDKELLKMDESIEHTIHKQVHDKN